MEFDLEDVIQSPLLFKISHLLRSDIPNTSIHEYFQEENIHPVYSSYWLSHFYYLLLTEGEMKRVKSITMQSKEDV